MKTEFNTKTEALVQLLVIGVTMVIVCVVANWIFSQGAPNSDRKRTQCYTDMYGVTACVDPNTGIVRYY